MKTNETRHASQVILKDGKSRLAEWNHDAPANLTVGDTVDLPVEISIEHPGYHAQAKVTRVELDTRTGITHVDIEAEATVPASERPVVTLNANFVSANLREAVEKQVRARLGSPVIEWEDSFESDPVLRLHQFRDGSDVSLVTLQTEVRKNLHGLLDTAGV